MNLYKNKVGRPSNELLRKRRNLKIFSIALVVIVALVGVWFSVTKLVNFDAKDKNALIYTNVSSSKMNIQVAGNGRGFAVGTKRYEADNWATNIGSQTVFVNSDGKTKIKIKTTFSSSFFNTLKTTSSNLVLSKKRYFYVISVYDSITNKGNRVYNVIMDPSHFTPVKDKRGTITHYTNTQSVQISKTTKYIKISVDDANTNKTKHYIELNTSTMPEVTMTPQGNANSQGIVTVDNTNTFKTKVAIKNPSKATLYYRVIQYNNFDNKNPKAGSCTKLSSDKNFNISGSVSGEKPQYSTTIRFYPTLSACTRDSKGTLTNPSTGNVRTRYFMPSGATAKYQLKKVYNAGNNWTRIAFDYDDLKAKIGKQTRNKCYHYTLSYGTYIMNNGVSYIVPSSNADGYYKVNFGADKKLYCDTSVKNKSFKEMYDVIKAKIKKGIPVSIHVKHPTNQHWVLVTGYKEAKVSDKISGGELRKYLYVLDPYDLKYGIMANDNLATEFYSDHRYVTWELSTNRIGGECPKK